MTEAHQQPPPYYQQPYYGPVPPNVYGPQQYGNPPYMATIQQPIVIAPGMVPAQQFITVRRSTNHGLCFLICILTGGLSIPCWIYACITED